MKHTVGTREEWLAARLELLKAEKELTRRNDELARQRQQLPWVRIDKDYKFETTEGPEHNLHTRWDHSDIPANQLTPKDGIPSPKDMPPPDAVGMSAFALEDDVAYHTYSAYARGLDALWGMYPWLDRAPKGRNETDRWYRLHDEYDEA
jgi:predicted dithiol-disulfide oxidoreductase (DUF899 family)